ncbi:MAG: TatD family hydrolase [Dehalococcoidia bacterium]|nr:TatD family hydrolase [Dehalococcoidia bacterium]
MIDTHAHLDEVENVEEAIERSRQAGLVAILAVGQSYESNQKVLELAGKHKGFVFPALGLHPWEISKELPTLDRSLSFIDDNLRSAVALGEVGLDYDKRVRALADKDVQQSVLRDLLFLARRYGKPVSLHSRYGWKDSLAIVAEAGLTKVVFHWFTGFSSSLEDLVKAGHYISATPAAEYHQEHRRAIKETPMGRLLLETDCPVEYGREQRYRAGPEHVVRSLNAVAEIRGIDSATVAAETTRNARELFGIG